MKKLKSIKKVAIIANSTWNIHNFRLNILSALEAQGYEVIVIAPVDAYMSYLNQTARTRHIPLLHLRRKSSNPLHDFLLFAELVGILKQEKPDLVINYTIKLNIYGNLAAAACGIRSVCSVTGLGYTFIHSGLMQHAAILLHRFSFLFTERVIFENIKDRELFIEKKVVSAEKSLSIKGCGINLQHFQPIALPKNNFCTFLFIARLLYDKGIQEYVNAAILVKKQFPNTQFQILGEFDNENPAAITETTLNDWVTCGAVQYLGYTTDVRNPIAQADCVVLPSYREAIPRVLQEAMAMTRPVISTLTAGCEEAVEDGKNGFLVPLKDSSALAEAMLRIIHLSHDERTALGNYGRQKAENEFDDKVIAQQFLQAIGV
ncbi:MAG: hypothetical protein RI894_781 [Bacteroidota bacterium]